MGDRILTEDRASSAAGTRSNPGPEAGPVVALSVSRAILDRLPGTVAMLFDRDLRIALAAGGEIDTRRLGRHALRGLRVAEAFPLDRTDELVRACLRALAGERSSVRCSSPDGSVDYLIRTAPFGERSGEAAVALWTDVTGTARMAQRQRQRAAELDAAWEASRALSRVSEAGEARRAICEASARLTGADVALLLEPDETEAGLRPRAATGVALPELELPLTASSDLAVAFRSNVRRSWEGGAGAAERALAEATGARAMLWQPLSHGAEVRAIVALGWRAGGDLDRAGRLIEAVAPEAAIAIGRGRAFERLVSLARTDSLTGLLNRRALERELSREIARAGREGSALAFALIDLDGFKEFNDARGHPAGDRLLVEAARAWAGQARATDVLGRFGGDEFALVLPLCGLDEAESMLMRLRESTPDPISFSAGIVAWRQGEGRSELLERVDRALYEAKAEGGAAIRVDRAGPGSV